MLECIPGLINAVRMIHSISRYYNTSERMTSLFVKVSREIKFNLRKTKNEIFKIDNKSNDYNIKNVYNR